MSVGLGARKIHGSSLVASLLRCAEYEPGGISQEALIYKQTRCPFLLITAASSLVVSPHISIA